jgi:hypothetical protein
MLCPIAARATVHSHFFSSREPPLVVFGVHREPGSAVVTTREGFAIVLHQMHAD